MHQFQCLIYEFLTYFGQWRNYVLEANSEFGDSNLVLLMNVGVSNLVIVNVKIQSQVLVWVLV